MYTWSTRETLVIAKPNKMKLQTDQEKFTQSRTDNLSAEALQTQFSAYRLLLAMAMPCYRVTILDDKENICHNCYEMLAKW